MKKFIEKHLGNYPFSKAEMDRIIGSLQLLILKKGQEFSEQGKICNKLGILKSGLLYACYDTERKGLQVSRFYYLPDNPVVTSFESFKRSEPSDESIIAVENSALLWLSNKDLEKLYEEIPELNKVGRHLAEESYIQARKIKHCFQALNKKERFDRFYSEHPGLVNRVERQHIASYLGMNRNLVNKYLTEISVCRKQG